MNTEQKKEILEGTERAISNKKKIDMKQGTKAHCTAQGIIVNIL